LLDGTLANQPLPPNIRVVKEVAGVANKAVLFMGDSSGFLDKRAW
jgi:hypothetical protein